MYDRAKYIIAQSTYVVPQRSLVFLALWLQSARSRCSPLTLQWWGSRIELIEVIVMVRDGRIHAETTDFPLAQAVAVYDKLKAGQITGRA